MNAKIAAQFLIFAGVLLLSIFPGSSDETVASEPQNVDSTKAPPVPDSVVEAASRWTPPLPDFIKKADAAALEGNALAAEGDFSTAQKKFLKALNLLNSDEVTVFSVLDRREAYARQLMVAVQGEIRQRNELREKANQR